MSQQGIFIVDAISLPFSCPDSGEVVLSAEFSNSSLPFYSSSRRTSLSKEFYSIYQLQFEIRDSLGVIRKRIQFSDTLEVATKEEALSDDFRNTKNYRVILQKGSYTISSILQDAQGKILQRQEVRSQMVQSQMNFVGTPSTNSDKVEVIDFWSSPSISSPSFTEKISESLYAQIPSGGKLPYSNIIVIVTAQCSYPTSKQEYKYTIEPLGNKAQLEKLWSWKLPLVAGTVEAQRFELVFNYSQSTTPFFQKVDISVPMFNCKSKVPSLIQRRGMIEFPLNLSTLLPGTYLLTISAVNSTEEVRRYFEVQWIDQAQSLKNSKSAFSAMYHLLTDKEFYSLEAATEFQRWEFIHNFWRKLDPTPNTSYNEAMIEYFRRADIARLKYQGINQKDGVLTDLGKILVLYGEPTSIENSKDEKSTETIRWVFQNKVQKQFEFKKTTNGLFTLQKYSNLSAKK